MKIDIFGKGIELNAALEEFIQDKIGSLEKYFGQDEASIRVEISRTTKHHRSGDIFYAEGNLKVGGQLMRATSEHADLHTAITEVRDELQAQVKKFKDKKLSARR